MTRTACALLLLIPLRSFAQYPFEIYPAKKYDLVSFKIIKVIGATQMAVANYISYTIKLVEGRFDGSILLYFKKKLIKKINGDFESFIQLTFPLYIEDVNGDGKFDLIIDSNGGGSGLASSNISSTYLANEGYNHFRATIYPGFYRKPQKEYDFNHDGNCNNRPSLAYYKGHNYWLFDLYTYKTGKLINISKKYNHPIAVPYLYKETFEATNKIPKKDLQKLSLS